MNPPTSLSALPSGFVTTTSQIRWRPGPPFLVVTLAVMLLGVASTVEATGAGPAPFSNVSRAPARTPSTRP